MMFLKKVLKKYYNISMFEGNTIAQVQAAGLNFCIICAINKILIS